MRLSYEELLNENRKLGKENRELRTEVAKLCQENNT